MKGNRLIYPILACFFVMGFGDILGAVMNQVKAECAENAGTIAWLMPIFAYVWFLAISIPTGIVSGRIGRKNTVLVSLVVTVAAMLLAFFASAERWYLYIVAFALVGIGNTIIQAALPALMSDVVEADKLTSRISLGQFVKALCAALTPVFVYMTATVLGNWKLIFPLYSALTFVVMAWLRFSRTPVERGASNALDADRTGFFSCLTALSNPYVAVMVFGVFFSVGADVGMAVAIPEYLGKVFDVEKNLAGMGPTVYFVAKTAAAFAGALVFERVSAAKCLPWCMGIGLALVILMPFTGSAFSFLAIVALVAFFTANSFGMCMGLAIARDPDKANEITSLMVMAIVGGGVVSAGLGLAVKAFGTLGIVLTLAGCLAYLFAAGLFASAKNMVKSV